MSKVRLALQILQDAGFEVGDIRRQLQEQEYYDNFVIMPPSYAGYAMVPEHKTRDLFFRAWRFKDHFLRTGEPPLLDIRLLADGRQFSLHEGHTSVFRDMLGMPIENICVFSKIECYHNTTVPRSATVHFGTSTRGKAAKVRIQDFVGFLKRSRERLVEIKEVRTMAAKKAADTRAKKLTKKKDPAKKVARKTGKKPTFSDKEIKDAINDLLSTLD